MTHVIAFKYNITYFVNGNVSVKFFTFMFICTKKKYGESLSESYYKLTPLRVDVTDYSILT